MPRRILQGRVTSDKTDKTITVLVERRFTHPKMKKTVKFTKKYHAHDADNVCKAGEFVRIIECAPYSKTKRWEVVLGDTPADAVPAEAEVEAS